MEQQSTPLQELAALEAVVHNDHLPEEIRHMAAIRLAALHDQLATAPSPTVSPARNAGQVVLDASTVRGAVVGVNAGTLNVCFAGPATPPSSPWLTSYLETLLMTCDQLRLARLVGRRQTGAAQHTTPRLRLQDVYTQLTTDGLDQPVGRPRTRTLSQLRSLFE